MAGPGDSNTGGLESPDAGHSGSVLLPFSSQLDCNCSDGDDYQPKNSDGGHSGSGPVTVLSVYGPVGPAEERLKLTDQVDQSFVAFGVASVYPVVVVAVLILTITCLTPLPESAEYRLLL